VKERNNTDVSIDLRAAELVEVELCHGKLMFASAQEAHGSDRQQGSLCLLLGTRRRTAR
jgi:hypothetical protein